MQTSIIIVLFFWFALSPVDTTKQARRYLCALGYRQLEEVIHPITTSTYDPSHIAHPTHGSLSGQGGKEKWWALGTLG